MQRKIEEARIKVIPTEVHGGVQIYRDTSVFNHIHNAALLRYLIDALFLAWPRDHLTTFTSDESNPEQVVKYFGPDRDVTLLDEPTANALVITRFLRDHPQNFTDLVHFEVEWV